MNTYCAFSLADYNFGDVDLVCGVGNFYIFIMKNCKKFFMFVSYVYFLHRLLKNGRNTNTRKKVL